MIPVTGLFQSYKGFVDVENIVSLSYYICTHLLLKLGKVEYSKLYADDNVAL